MKMKSMQFVSALMSMHCIHACVEKQNPYRSLAAQCSIEPEGVVLMMCKLKDFLPTHLRFLSLLVYGLDKLKCLCCIVAVREKLKS